MVGYSPNYELKFFKHDRLIVSQDDWNFGAVFS